MNGFGYVALVLLALSGPCGKICIKKSVEYNSTKKFFLNYSGLFFLLFLGPFSNFLAYYYVKNSIVAPVASSGIIFNLLASFFVLKEGKQMGLKQFVGIVLFIIGLFLILFSYSYMDGDENQPLQFNWGVFSLFFGIWILLITFLSNFAYIFFENNKIQLFCWSLIAGLLSGVDIIVSMDSFFLNYEKNDTNELYKGIVGLLFFGVSGLTSIYILNEMLLRDNPLHLVTTIMTSVTLLCDVIADLFVFNRYLHWNTVHYVFTILGLFLMILGIVFINMVQGEKQYKKIVLFPTKTSNI